MGVISVLRAGVRGCGCFCAAIGSGWAVRGDAGNCGCGCRPVCGWAWPLLLLLSCVAFWGGQCAIFSAKSREKPNFSVKAGIFGGNRAETCCGRLGGSTEVWEIAGAAVALRAGVRGRVTFDFVLRCVRMWTVRIFRRNCAKSRKFQRKPEFSAEIGQDWSGNAPWAAG